MSSSSASSDKENQTKNFIKHQRHKWYITKRNKQRAKRKAELEKFHSFSSSEDEQPNKKIAKEAHQTNQILLNEYAQYENIDISEHIFEQRQSDSIAWKQASVNESSVKSDESLCNFCRTNNSSIQSEESEYDHTLTSSDSDSDNNKSNEKELLYEKSSHTVLEFLNAIHFFKKSHKLSDLVVKEILKLFAMFLPNNNRVPKSLASLEKQLMDPEEGNYHLFCSGCLNVTDAGSIKTYKSTNSICDSCEKEYLTFATFNPQKQLERILSNKEYLSQIVKNNKESRKPRDSVIKNAFDGSIYQDFIHNSVDRNEELLISINLNTDGAPLSTSKNYSLWPLFGTILELDLSSREKFSNLLIFGVWLDCERPEYKVFFEKSIEKIIELINKPFSYQNLTIRVRCQMFIADLPAKAAALNIKQFNGDFGCVSCIHPGQFNNQFRKMTYPPEDTKYPLRDSNEFNEMATIAEETGDEILGIKGKTPFANIIILPDQVPFDYMHLVLQGHTMWLLNNYFFKKQFESYIGDKKDEVNDLLILHKVPHTMSRKFNIIHKNLMYKSSEIKLFIFHLCVPLLIDILPIEYWCLLFIYVYSVRSLYEPVLKEDLNGIEEMIDFYYESLNEYFNESAYDYTVHAHVHLVEQVKKHGPLGCHSQFVFEGALGNLKNLVNGSRGYIQQIVRKIIFYNNSKDEPSETIKKDTLLKPLEKNILTDEELDFFNVNGLNIKLKEVLTATRCKIDGKTYHSIAYSRKGKTNSYTVCFKDKSKKERFGEIIEFYEICGKLFCKIKAYKLIEENSILPRSCIPKNFQKFVNLRNFCKFFKAYDATKYQTLIIDSKSILSKCLIVQSKRNSFFSKLVYDFEHD